MARTILKIRSKIVFLTELMEARAEVCWATRGLPASVSTVVSEIVRPGVTGLLITDMLVGGLVSCSCEAAMVAINLERTQYRKEGRRSWNRFRSRLTYTYRKHSNTSESATRSIADAYKTHLGPRSGHKAISRRESVLDPRRRFSRAVLPIAA